MLARVSRNPSRAQALAANPRTRISAQFGNRLIAGKKNEVLSAITKKFTAPLLRSFASKASPSKPINPTSGSTGIKQSVPSSSKPVQSGATLLHSTSLDHTKPPISIHNSLTGQKSQIRTLEKNTVLWYSCGPTVYDHSHVGHARNYVSLDILLRIMKGLFGHEVLHVMGMTDVDDKILKRAGESGVEPLALAERFEKDFFEDMKALNVAPPTVVTRVTQHMDDIILYIEKILANGYAYRTEDGSVYLDTEKLGQPWSHMLRPKVAVTEAESPNQLGKRRKEDFALWKSTSSQEKKAATGASSMSWPSPWGVGRPGWHIECSAMSNRYFGRNFDVHWGGIDLAFPHHNNEIAQAYAYYEYHKAPNSASRQPGDTWVANFMHSGHLHIEGLKMSKSLKNFVTIKAFLKDSNREEFRMFCVLNNYNTNSDFSQDRIADARNMISKLQDFSNNTNLVIENEAARHPTRFWTQTEHELHQKFQQAKIALLERLADDFDTFGAMKVVLDLAKSVYIYVAPERSQKRCPILLSNIMQYYNHIMTTIGFTFHLAGSSAPAGGVALTGAPLDPRATQILDAALQFRSQVRQEMLRSKGGSGDLAVDWKGVLKMADNIRDKVFPELGIIVKDSSSDQYTVKVMDQPAVKQYLQDKAQVTKKSQKQEKVKAQMQDQVEQLEMKDYMRDEGKYSKYDARGVPTHDVDGNSLSEPVKRKLESKFAKLTRMVGKFKA